MQSTGNPSPFSSRKKILLLDQDPIVQHLRRTILELHGFLVEPTTSIEEARAQWKPELYDLVLVDAKYNLKTMLEFCEEIKNLSPEQRYALLVGANMYVPRNSCPDEVIIREDGPGHLVNSIKNLLGVAEA